MNSGRYSFGLGGAKNNAKRQRVEVRSLTAADGYSEDDNIIGPEPSPVSITLPITQASA